MANASIKAAFERMWQHITTKLSESAVLYSEAQTLTDEQKLQAQTNIGIEISTDDEIVEMLMQEDMFPIVTDSDGSLLADENDNILLW